MKSSIFFPIKLLSGAIAALFCGWQIGVLLPAALQPITQPLEVGRPTLESQATQKRLATAPLNEKMARIFPHEASIFVMRRFMREKSPEEAAQWIKQCKDPFVKQFALAALAIEHPQFANQFFDGADPGTQQLMLLGWSQSVPEDIFPKIVERKIEGINLSIVLPTLLQSDFANTVKALKAVGRKGVVELGLPILKDWAACDPAGVAAELARGKGASLNPNDLWAAVSSEYVNKRDPWLLVDLIKHWDADSADGVVEAFKSAMNGTQNINALAIAAGQLENLDPKILKSIPGGRAESLLSAMRQGAPPDLASTLAADGWTAARAEKFAQLTADAESVSHLLENADLPLSLQNSLAGKLAETSFDTLMATKGLDPKVAFAASVKAGHILDYLQEANSKFVDGIFQSPSDWKAVGLSPEQAFSLIKNNPTNINDLNTWSTNFAKDWLKENPVLASETIKTLPPGPALDSCATATIEFCLQVGDLQGAKAWADEISSEQRKAIIAKYPELGASQ